MLSSQIKFGQVHVLKEKYCSDQKVIPLVSGKYKWTIAPEATDITSVTFRRTKNDPLITITFDGFGLRQADHHQNRVWVIGPQFVPNLSDGMWVNKDITITRGQIGNVSVRHLHGDIDQHIKDNFILDQINQERNAFEKERDVLDGQLTSGRENLTAVLQSIVSAKYPNMRPSLSYTEKNPFKLFASDETLLRELVFVYLKFLRKTEIINDNLADSFNSALTTFEELKKVVADAENFDAVGATARANSAWEAKQGGVSS